MIYEDLIGVPYKFGGRDLDGMDCWGLCIEVARRNGVDLPDYPFLSNYQEKVISDLVRAEKGKFKKFFSPEPFSIVTLYISRPFVSHCGMVMEDCKSFIHTMQARGRSCIEKLDHPFWKTRIEGFYQWIGSPINYSI